MLGYFFDAASRSLRSFLEDQRAERRRRIVEIAARLADLGCPVDAQQILKSADGSDGRSVGRPRVADALVAAGHVGSRSEAFDLWLGEGRPAFVSRRGADPGEVIDVIHRALGIASLAHPGLLQMDDIIPGLVRGGLDAIEARHAEHDADTEQRYRQLAEASGLAVSGGSDFHGEDSRARELGEISLPDPDFALLEARAATRRT
jgi:predicted metal-dependent phosphoesterase TrpH